MHSRWTILLLLTLAAPAAAQEPPGDLERAKQHYRSGEAHFAEGAYDLAIDDYQAAYALTMRAPLLYNLGAAYRRKAEQTGALEDRRAALDFYRQYVVADPDGEGAPDARGWIASLEREVAAAEAPPPAPPPEPPAPPPAPPAAPALPAVIREAPAPAPAASLTVEDRPPAGSSHVRTIAGLAAIGGGVALVATALVLGLRARGAASALDGLERGESWDQGRYEQGRAEGRAGLICGGVGLAAVAGGLVTLFVF